MALASLTIDLSLQLARFEADSGKAAQIVARDQERMSTAGRGFERQLERLADQANRTSGQFLALKAAELGVGGDGTKIQRLIDQIDRQGSATAAASASQVSAIKGVTAAAEESAQKQRALNSELIASIRQVNAAYEQRRAELIKQEAAGQIQPADLKSGLAGLQATRGDAIRQLKETADAQRRAIVQAEGLAKAEAEAAAAAEVAAAKQRAAAQSIIDAQNGLNASYRQRLALLRELRDAGNLTPQQFRAAGTELVGQQPVSQQRRQAAQALQAEIDARKKAEDSAADAAAAAAEKQRLAAQSIIDQQRGISAAYRQRLAALRELRDAELISPAQFRQAGIELVNAQPTLQRRRQEAEAAQAAADAQKRAEEQVAAAAEASAERQRVAAQAVIDQQNGLSASYRQRLAALRDLRDAELISPAQFRRAGTELVNTQPAVAARRAEAEAAKKAADEIAAAAAKKAAAETLAAENFVRAIQTQADAIGKTRAQLLLEEAARRGVADQVRPYIERISQADASLNKFGRTSNVARYQLLQLQYTVSDTVASLASGISPLTILLQQGGQVIDAFSSNGGLGAAVKTVGGLFTPLRVAVGAAGAAIGAFAFAAYQGAEQSKELNDAIVLTGNYAGQTEGRFNRMARTIAASGEIAVSTAREFGVALINTGEVGARNFDLATEAAARFGTATGRNAKEVAGIFAGLNRDVGAGAAQLNQQYNFLTAAQLQQIRTLQEAGRATEALGIVYDALNGRLKALEPNLGTLDRAIRTVSTTWKSFWDAAFDVGRRETIEDRLAGAQQRLDAIRARTEQPANFFVRGSNGPRGAAATAAAEGDVRTANRDLLRQTEATSTAAFLAKLNKDVADSAPFVRGQLERAKATSALTREIEALNKAFRQEDALAAVDPAFKPTPQGDREAALKAVRERFTDKPAQTEANQVEKAERDKALKAIEQDLAAQRAAYQFHNQYLDRIYAEGQISLEAFFGARRDAAAEDEQAQIQALNKQIEIQQRYRDSIKSRDPSEAVQAEKAIIVLQEEVAAATVQRQRRVVVANAEEAASYRQLRDRVTEFSAQLLELEGNSAGAAAVRAQAAIQNARLLAAQSGGAISEEDVRRQERALEAANKFAEAQRRVALSTADASRAEEAFLLIAEKGGLSLYEKERGVFAIRQEALGQLQRLTAEAQRLAETTSDPKIASFAADLALQFAKAADNVDPIIVRLRAGVDDLSSALASTFTNSLANAESLEDLVKGLGKNLQGFALRISVQEPLEDFFRTSFRSLLPSAGGAGLGAGAAGAASATAAQTAAISAQTSVVATSTGALTALTQAAGAAASALAAIAGKSAASGFASFLGFASPGGSGLEGLSPDALSFFFHSGGVVGAGGRAARVPASAFAGARRYHGGGIAGLAPDEVPSVLRRGEEVVRRDDPRHRWNAGGGGRPSMNVQIYNSNASAVRTEAGDDGSLKVFIDAAKNAVADDISRGGKIYSATKQRFNLKPALARRE